MKILSEKSGPHIVCSLQLFIITLQICEIALFVYLLIHLKIRKHTEEMRTVLYGAAFHFRVKFMPKQFYNLQPQPPK